MDTKSLAQDLATETGRCLDYGLNKIEHCVRQLNGEQIWWRPQPEMNSIGNLLLHVVGNLRQWIVAGVGDLPDTRIRRAEFEQRDPLGAEELLTPLRETIRLAKETLLRTSEGELQKPVRIQGHDVTKLEAALHSTTHFQGHVQEIICMTRLQLGTVYQFEWSPSTTEEGA